MTQHRWAWAEIDLSAIQDNVRTLKALTKPGTLFMAVVKADGYGHGALHVARAALAAGADRLGVATLDEGVELRDAGITGPIQLLSEPPETTIRELLDYDLVPAVTTREFAVALGKQALAARCRSSLSPQDRHRHEPHRRAGRGSSGVRAFAGRLPGPGARGDVHALRDGGRRGRLGRAAPARAVHSRTRGDEDRGRRPGHRPRCQQPGDHPVSGLPLRHGPLRHRPLRSAPVRGHLRRSRAQAGHEREGSCEPGEAHRHGRGRLLRPDLDRVCAHGDRDAAARLRRRRAPCRLQRDAGSSGREAVPAGRAGVHGPVHGGGSAGVRGRLVGTRSCSSGPRAPRPSRWTNSRPLPAPSTTRRRAHSGCAWSASTAECRQSSPTPNGSPTCGPFALHASSGFVLKSRASFAGVGTP